MNRKTQMTSEIPLASSDADDMRPPSADRGGIGGHKGSATSQELAEQFGVSSSTLERVRRGNKDNNGSNSGADADDHDITSEIRSASAEASDIPSEFERAETASSSADDLGKEFGVSGSTIERVRTILDQATPEQIQALRAKSESGEGPGVHTMYEQVQSDKLKKRLSSQQTVLDRNFEGTSSVNKDFRTITRDDIAHESIDLVIVLDFPEPRIREDERRQSIRTTYAGFYLELVSRLLSSSLIFSVMFRPR